MKTGEYASACVFLEVAKLVEQNNQLLELKKTLIKNDNIKADRHTYSVSMVYLTLCLERDSSLSFREATSVVKLFHREEIIHRPPSHETCIQWNLKLGLYKLLRGKDSNLEWCWIIDRVLGEGQVGF